MNPRVQEILNSGPWAPQRSEEWFRLRHGMITASDAAAIIGISRFDSRSDVIYKKCGVEKRFSQMSRDAMMHGVVNEDPARIAYERVTGEKVHEVGLIQHPLYPFIGASADGVTESGKLIEIKCPKGDLRKEIPVYYVPQVQLCMEVLDLDTCDYIEFSASTRQIRIFKIDRDREWFQKHLQTFKDFWRDVEARRKLPLCEIQEDEAHSGEGENP